MRESPKPTHFSKYHVQLDTCCSSHSLTVLKVILKGETRVVSHAGTCSNNTADKGKKRIINWRTIEFLVVLNISCSRNIACECFMKKKKHFWMPLDVRIKEAEAAEHAACVR